MRLASTIAFALCLSACASLSQRPTDLQPAMVVAMETSPPPKPRPEPQWDECFNEALKASPGLIPEQAQDCCNKTQAPSEVLKWCTRHALAVREFNEKYQTSEFYLIRRVAWEHDFCHLLMGLPRNGDTPLAVPPTGIETSIQCKISNSLMRPGALEE
ncbi:hypothetical protein HZC53_03175 [Candidatus Uhrbacteria bacterium]|nr:hypothetical protein [Candidatus Uhrbacteria bacterium]